MKFRDLSSSFTEYKRPVKNEPALENSYSIKSVKKYLEEKKFKSVEPIAHGGYGDVLSAVTPKYGSIAIKTIKNVVSWDIEELIWPVLKHPNIVPLYDVIDVKEMDLKMYIMPKHPTSLHKIIKNEKFRMDSKGLNRIRRWLRNTAEGLQYLHSKGCVHLDIKSNNVLITATDVAVLCDFSGINLKRLPCTRLVAPIAYRPPECFNLSEKKDGAAFDMWTYAMMSLHVLTLNSPNLFLKRVNNYKTWKTVGELFLKQYLEKANFCRIMRSSLPAVRLTDENLLVAHDFVSSMMQWNPDNRPSAFQILDHAFLLIKEGKKSTSSTKEHDEVMDVVNQILEKRLNTTHKDLVNHAVSSEFLTVCANGCRVKNFPNINSFNALNRCSVEKLEMNNSLVEKASSKRSIRKRFNGWVTKKWNRVKKVARKNCELFVENLTEKHWTEHWTLFAQYC